MFSGRHSSAFVFNDSRWWISVCIISFIRRILYTVNAVKRSFRWDGVPTVIIILFLNIYTVDSGRQSTKRIAISIYIYIYYDISWRLRKKRRVEKQIKINHLGMTVGLGFEISAPRKSKSIVQFPGKFEHIFSFLKQMHFAIGDETMIPNTATPVI